MSQGRERARVARWLLCESFGNVVSLCCRCLRVWRRKVEVISMAMERSSCSRGEEYPLWRDPENACGVCEGEETHHEVKPLRRESVKE